MTQITFRWAGNAPSSGDAHAGGLRRVVVIPKVGIQTPHAILGWPPGNQGLMHPRLAADGVTFAGTGKDDHDRAWRWSPAAGWTDEGPGYGPKSCIFVGQTLHVVRPSPAGAVGYRHVRDDGTIVTATASRSEAIADPRSGLFEFTDYGDICIGQLDDERYGGGVGVRFADGILRRLTFQDLRARGKIVDVVVDRRGEDFAIVAVDLDQHRTTITEGTFEEFHAMDPAVPLVTLPPAPPIEELPAIGRACWVGFFMFADGPPAPGNCTVAIRRVHGRQTRPFIVSDETIALATGQILGHWVGVEHIKALLGRDGTVEDLEGLARLAWQAGRRPVAYWDARTWPRRPELPPDSWVCVQAYRGVRESREDFEASVAREVARITGWGYEVVIIPQCYVQLPPSPQTTDLASVIAPCLRVARDFPSVVAVLPFHASDSKTGRATGLEDHPEVRPLWQHVADATAAPAFAIYPPVSPPVVVPPVRGVPGDLTMFAKFNDPATKLLTVKRAKPVEGSKGLFTLILPPMQVDNETQDDRVFSCQGDGSPGHRKPGTEGGWEKCRVAGNIATFQPEPGEFYSWPFVEVDGL